MNPVLAFILVLFENNTDSVNTGLCTSQYLLAMIRKNNVCHSLILKYTFDLDSSNIASNIVEYP